MKLICWLTICNACNTILCGFDLSVELCQFQTGQMTAFMPYHAQMLTFYRCDFELRFFLHHKSYIRQTSIISTHTSQLWILPYELWSRQLMALVVDATCRSSSMPRLLPASHARVQTTKTQQHARGHLGAHTGKSSFNRFNIYPCHQPWRILHVMGRQDAARTCTLWIHIFLL